MNQKGFAPLFLLPIILIGLIAVYLIYAYTASILNTPVATPSVGQKACTMEAKICPDGSSVGRTGANCEFPPCPATFSSDISNWKTYTNQSLGISFKYPADKNFQEYSASKGKSIMIGSPNSDYALNIIAFDNSQKANVKDYIKTNFQSLYPNVEINGKKLTFQDLKLTEKQLAGLQVIEVEFGGQSPHIYFQDPANLRMYKLSTTFNNDLLNQILSTLKFNN